MSLTMRDTEEFQNILESIPNHSYRKNCRSRRLMRLECFQSGWSRATRITLKLFNPNHFKDSALHCILIYMYLFIGLIERVAAENKTFIYFMPHICACVH